MRGTRGTGLLAPHRVRAPYCALWTDGLTGCPATATVDGAGAYPTAC